MLQSKKTSVYCSFRFTATKSNKNMREPLETKPESASNPPHINTTPPIHTYPPRPPIHTQIALQCSIFFEKHVAVREHEQCVWICVSLWVQYISTHTHTRLWNVCALPRPAIWLDPQRGSVSVTFTFRWRFRLSAVPCCSWCSNVGRHGWLPGPLIHTPGGKLLNPTDFTIRLSKSSLSLSLSLF